MSDEARGYYVSGLNLMQDVLEDVVDKQDDTDKANLLKRARTGLQTTIDRFRTKPSEEIQECTDDGTTDPPPPDTPKSRGARINGYILKGVRFPCKNAIRTLAEVILEFDRLDRNFMYKFASETEGTKRRLVSRNPSGLYDTSSPSLQRQVRDLGNGWWLATNTSTKTIRQVTKIACEIMELDFGVDFQLIEESTDSRLS